MVRYNASARKIGIKNWGKHNLNKAGRPMYDCVKKELEEVKDVSLIEYVSEGMTREKIKFIYDDYIVRFYNKKII